MAVEVLMPRQGNTVESCIVLEWKKKEGDTVAAGEPICEVETDKATFEVEATGDGTLLKTFFEEGDDVPVLTPIAVIGETGEDISGFGGAAVVETKVEESDSPTPTVQAAVASSSTPLAPAVPAAAQANRNGDSRLAISPRARHLAEEKSLDPEVLRERGSGPGGRIIERDVVRHLASGEPLTKAAMAGVESGLTAPASGSGIGGRVRLGDLTAKTAGLTVSDYPGVVNRREMKGVRKIVAERMKDSLQTTAQLTLHASADARSILDYRKKLKTSPEELGISGITINDLVLYAAVQTLKRYPALNAHFLGDSVEEHESVHAAFAVDTDRGLMVPVIRFADRLCLKDLASETKRLSTGCLEGGVNPDELSGGTITVTNLGVLGVEMFTPVLNAPQVAILGVCSINLKPVLEKGEVVHYPHIGLSLTIDHQAVDGAPAGRFLKDLCGMVANFQLTLAG